MYLDKTPYLQLLTDRNVIFSQLTFAGTGSTAAAINSAVKVPSVEITSSLAARTISEAPWLLKMFPDMVMEGSLIMKDGHLFLYGLSVMDLVSFSAICITIFFAVFKFIVDMRASVRMAEENAILRDRLEQLEKE